ncbi:hypothetical protein SAY86_011461 [Trapa natans]|uniref:Uncharacterized protein n=1 Tax=Trapa natans TaxID=22666 RepID=A0AAN7LWF8_TRANT|nr:hypothetical protein SAY86_011461 [Trapa natans]
MWVVVTKPPFILPLSTAPRRSGGSARRRAVTASISPTNSDPNARPLSKEISGSDILWALQRAAAKKSKSQRRAKRKTEKKISDEDDTDDDDGKHREVRPIRIDSEWGPRLDDLEDRLRQLSRLV